MWSRLRPLAARLEPFSYFRITPGPLSSPPGAWANPMLQSVKISEAAVLYTRPSSNRKEVLADVPPLEKLTGLVMLT